MGKIRTEKVRQVSLPYTKPNETTTSSMGVFRGSVVNNPNPRQRRDAYSNNLGDYYLRSNGATVPGSTLSTASLAHDLVIRSGADTVLTNGYADCQILCQSGVVWDTAGFESNQNNLAGGPSDRFSFQVFGGYCTRGDNLGNNVGTLSLDDFRSLCTDYHNSHPAPTIPPTTQPPSTQPTTQVTTQQPTQPPTAPNVPSPSPSLSSTSALHNSTSVSIKPGPTNALNKSSASGGKASVAQSLAYISSELPSSTYSQIVAATQAHTLPAFSATSVFIPASSNPGLEASPGVDLIGSENGVSSQTIGFSVLGAAAGLGLAITGILGTAKAIKSYLSRDAKNRVAAEEAAGRDAAQEAISMQEVPHRNDPMDDRMV